MKTILVVVGLIVFASCASNRPKIRKRVPSVSETRKNLDKNIRQMEKDIKGFK